MGNFKIAIIGAGPAGCYLAQALCKLLSDADITIFDRLPVPYGLIRYGVAADHQGTKALTKQFDRMFTREKVRFVGNLDVGHDLSLDRIRKLFDVTVLATGLYRDRRLGIAGEDRPHVYGAGRITRLLNAHPSETGFLPQLGQSPVVIGNGNVAIDVVRLLCKSPADMAGSDVAPVHDRLFQSPRKIAVVGRSPASAARFDTALVRGLARLSNVRFLLSGDTGDHNDITQAIQELTSVVPEAGTIEVTFHFGWRPWKIEESTMQFIASDDQRKSLELPLTSVITAIGFEAGNEDIIRRTSRNLTAASDDCRLDENLYCTGWARRGAIGAIPDNRTDAKAVAEAIVNGLDAQCQRSSLGYAGIPESIRQKTVDFDGWSRIDIAETAAAPSDRLRRKLDTTSAMVDAANRHQSHSVTRGGQPE